MSPEQSNAMGGQPSPERRSGFIGTPPHDEVPSASMAFDVHAAALRAAGRDILLTARPNAGWRLDRLQLKRLLLEFRNSGGASIVAGESPADAIVIATFSSAKSGELVNGRPINPLDIVLFPPAGKYIQTSSHPHEWITAVVPVSQFPQNGELETGAVDILAREIQPAILRSPTLAQKIIMTASMIERLAGDGAGLQMSPLLHDRETSLLETLSIAVWAALDCLVLKPPSSRARGTKAGDLAYQAFRQLDTPTADGHRIADLCRAFGATERQLRRSFKSQFAIGPNKLARLQRINRVRRLLVDRKENRFKIGSILASCEVTEPGRFASEYKALFGETPSQTRNRYRPGSVRGFPPGTGV
jgi:AraC-like DNA-binding protein